jgi:hypothetical protein
MAVTYTLKINELHIVPVAEGQTDVVVQADWVYTGDNGTSTAGFGGSTNFTYTPGTPFTPYSDLTETQVAGWVESSWTPEQVQAMQDALLPQLDTMIAPLPWVPPTPPAADEPTPPAADEPVPPTTDNPTP